MFMKIPSIFPFPPSSHTSGAPDRDRGPQVRLFDISLVLAAASAVLGACARMVPGFAHTYSITVYPVLVNTIGRFSSIFPFSLSEAGLYLAAVFCILNLLFLIKKPLAALSRLFFLACLLLFLYTAGCGINYYRTPFSYEAGMVMEQSSAGELYSLCLFLTEQINSTLTETDHSGDALKGLYPGQTEDTPLPSAAMLRELGMEGVKSMKGLGTAYPQLSGYYPYPKPLMNPRLLSIQQLCGIYSPFTIEANYNREMPYYNIPHTICHELSHLKGFMREDEANFIGYLACIGSDSPDFRYSGYLTGWVYAGNALAKADLEAYYGLYGRLAPEAARDLAWNNQFWDRFDGKVAEASTQLNDRYLKANNQEDGVRSYGRMVDLMLAYYRDSQ
nr:DUF3810 domain-containing protein [uncultured Lachnoclostridium sp.]